MTRCRRASAASCRLFAQAGQPVAHPHDATTAVATFWDALVDNDYLTQEPKNPMQDNSTTVAAAPAAGVGWVWDGDLIQAVGTDNALFAD